MMPVSASSNDAIVLMMQGSALRPLATHRFQGVGARDPIPARRGRARAAARIHVDVDDDGAHACRVCQGARG